MGYDAFVHGNKKKYTEKTMEELFLILGYEKRNKGYYCGNDEEYKYDAGVQIWKYEENEQERIYRVRVQAFCSEYDLKKANDTISSMKKYCSAWFESDYGKNRYFQVGELVKGAENGCYIAINRLDNHFSLLRHSLKKYPADLESERKMEQYNGIPTPSSFNANVYLAYLCALIEEYFRSTYIALLKYSNRKDKILTNKLSPYDLAEISEGKKTVEETYARTLSFQNIQKIVHHFQQLDSKLDIGKSLKEPYHGRKKNLYSQINEIFERRHNMVHRVEVDSNYTSEKLIKDIKDVEEAMIRVYHYLCEQYGWKKLR